MARNVGQVSKAPPDKNGTAGISLLALRLAGLRLRGDKWHET
ncbi:hypothetical protein PYR66_03350 [Klebsiella aerogenes]|nr:hypothetical protein PYR66_03350 [Klebsiella aerogenes]